MFKYTLVLLVLISVGLSNYCVSSLVPRRNYFNFRNRNSLDEDQDVSFYAAIPDIADNDMESEMGEKQEPCPKPDSLKEFRMKSNEIHRRVETLGCEPRQELINLTGTDPRADLVPSVALVRRCGGHCLGQLNQCAPVSGRIIWTKIPVLKILRTHEPHCESVEEIYVEEHEECECERVFDFY